MSTVVSRFPELLFNQNVSKFKKKKKTFYLINFSCLKSASFLFNFLFGWDKVQSINAPDKVSYSGLQEGERLDAPRAAASAVNS